MTNKKAQLGKIISLPYILVTVTLIMVIFVALSWTIATLKTTPKFEQSQSAHFTDEETILSANGDTKAVMLLDLFILMRKEYMHSPNKQDDTKKKFIIALKNMINKDNNCILFSEQNKIGYHENYAFIYEFGKIVDISSNTVDIGHYFNKELLKSNVYIPDNPYNPWTIGYYYGRCENVKE